VEEWPSDSEVYVKLYQGGTDTLVFNDTLTTYADGNFDINISDYSILAGDKVVVFDGTSYKEHILNRLAIAIVEFTANYIQGTTTVDAAFDY